MRVAVPPRHRARAPVVERLVGGEGDDRVEEREVDPLADTAALPPGERGGDREARVHAAQHVGHGDADLLRSPAAIVALSGDAHEAAQSLKQEVVAGTLGVRTRLPEAGDGTIDEARILPTQVLVPEPVPGKVSHLEVLDQDVAPGGEASDELL